jgi:hypothetical protein
MKYLTKLSIEKLLHPFQTFILGQKQFASKIAIKMKIPLIFYGENEAEHGNSITDNLSSERNNKFFSVKNYDDLYLSGVKVKELINDHNLKYKNLKIFLPEKKQIIEKQNIKQHYLGYFINWIPQEAYYFAVKNAGFKPRPFRTQGTYSKYNSIDDKIDDLHYYTQFIKFGYGRTHCDVSQEIRNDHMDQDEGKKLIKKYDGEFPNLYFDEIMKYLNFKKRKFFSLCDKFRSPHLWKKVNKKFLLRHTVNLDGTDD